MMASSPADDVQVPGGKKVAAGGGDGAATMRPTEQGLKCPRCDSPNTKFCYYNNYSLAQPRYFCKTCRRYWTKGGALRNVPVGGGCRKSKKSKSSSISSTNTSSFSSVSSRHSSDSKDGGADHELRFYPGLPSMVDFHLTGGLPFSRLHHPNVGSGVFDATAAEGPGAANHFIAFGDLSCSSATLPTEATGATAASLIGFSYPIQAVAPPFVDMGMGGGDATTSGTSLPSMHGNLAASIESLSSINQGLHWKLQQQRLAMFFGGDQSQHHHSKGAGGAAATGGGHRLAFVDDPHQTMSCHVPASSKEVSVAGGGVSSKGSMAADANSSSTEWFLENSGGYSAPNAHGSSVDNGAAATGTANNWNGIQTWGDMHQFSALP